MRTDLGSKEETQVTTGSTASATCQTIFDLERHFLGQTELDLARQSSGLAEIDEVLEREGKSDRLGKLDGDVFAGVLDVGVLADGHRAIANVTLAGELDSFLCGFENDCKGQVVLAQ